MNLSETLKQFKAIAPHPAYKETSKRAILATLPRERWSAWRAMATVFETGIAVALSVFFILVITGQLSGTPYVSPVQFSVIDPKTLSAEAQAVDIQIQLASIAYQETTTTPSALAGAAVTTKPSFKAMLLIDTSTPQISATSTPTSTAISAADLCALTSTETASLEAIQNDPGLTPDQELAQELTLRKQLLSQTITCSVKAAQSLQTTLRTITTATPDGASIKVQLLVKIDDAINFYNIESVKLNNAGISSSEAIAREMIAWQAVNYVPLEGSVSNFTLWSKNQVLFQTAQTRLMQTERIVVFIENAAGGNDNLSAGLKATQSSFSDAQNDNAIAVTDLVQLQPPDQSLADIQKSLQSLADTYQKFSDLNKLIQTLLPTASQ